MKKHLRSAQLIGGLTLLSRILGLVRDVLCAALFGAGMIWDAFVLAWTIPNLFRRLFGEGALSSAFIPVFARVKEEEGLDQALSLTRITLTFFGLFLLAAIILFYLIGALIYPTMESGAKYTLVLELLFLLAPYLVCICLAGVCGGALNSLGRFGLPAALPVFLNILWIAVIGLGCWFFADKKSLVLFMAGGLLLGGFLQLALVLRGLKSQSMAIRPSWQPRDPHLGEVKKLMLPVVVGLAAMQLNVLLDRVIAEAMVPGNGAVSALYYGNRLIQFPMAIIGIAIGTAIFPSLSKQVVLKDQKSFSQTLIWALGLTLFVVTPASLGLMALAKPAVSILFQRGHFDLMAASRTSKVLLFYCPSVFFYSLVHVVTRGFYAHKDTSSPVKIAGVMVGINLVLNLCLVPFLAEAGLALATSLSSALNLVVLWIVFHRKYSHLSLSKVAIPFFRALCCALVMALVIFWLLQKWSVGSSFLYGALRLVSLVLIGVVLYGGLTFLTGGREGLEIWKSFRRDKKGKKS